MDRDYFKRVDEAVRYILGRAKVSPKVMLVLSGGISKFLDKVEDKISLTASDIPNFPKPTAEGHSGKITFGRVSGVDVAVFQGRFHYYEGHKMSDIVFPVFVMNKLGAKILILTSATGGINKDLSVGDIVLLKDHINFMGTNPLIGISTLLPENQFPDMTDAYSKRLREIARMSAHELGMELREGVYIASSGPSYETPAEVKAFRMLGADVAGMSVVPEITVAKFLKMETLAFSCIANPAADLHPGGMNHKEVLEAMRGIDETLSRLLFKIFGYL
jgi:purine-nucleoside phosphorylase